MHRYCDCACLPFNHLGLSSSVVLIAPVSHLLVCVGLLTERFGELMQSIGRNILFGIIQYVSLVSRPATPVDKGSATSTERATSEIQFWKPAIAIGEEISTHHWAVQTGNLFWDRIPTTKHLVPNTYYLLPNLYAFSTTLHSIDELPCVCYPNLVKPKFFIHTRFRCHRN